MEHDHASGAMAFVRHSSQFPLRSGDLEELMKYPKTGEITMKVLYVLIIGLLVIALLIIPVGAAGEPDSGAAERIGSGTPSGAIVMAPIPIVPYKNYFYFFNHGTMAKTEFWNNPNIDSVYDFGWGHRTVLKAAPVGGNSTAWIDLPITGVASYTGRHPMVRYATIQMYSETMNGGIIWVHVYNGHTIVKEIPVNWHTDGTWQDFTVDLDGYYDMQRGMNMDVLINNDWDGATRINEIGGYGAKAEW